MRADRLLSLLMLLQARGKMTAGQLAERLEVSERTIYRDVEALAVAGVPVYTECGPGGGCALLPSYRSDLTGLTEDEVRALFLLSIPAPLSALGVGEELRAALLKLSAALPASRRQEEERVRGRVHLDSTWWHQIDEPLPHLRTVYQAVREDRRLHLTMRRRLMPRGETRIELQVDPYGLVAKANLWYLVAARGARLAVYRLSDVLGARASAERFARPAGFELEAFWQQWCRDYERQHQSYPVTVRVSPELVPDLGWRFGDEDRSQAAQAIPDAAGWLRLTLRFEWLGEARDRLLALGGAVEVLEPEALRLSLADYAEQAASRYRLSPS